jgi:hypothetical protein
MAVLHIKVEEDADGKVEATVDTFDTAAETNDGVTIYNDANAGGISVTVDFPGTSALATNPIVVAADSSVSTTVSASAGTYPYTITASLPVSGGSVVIDPRFIIGGGTVAP